MSRIKAGALATAASTTAALAMASLGVPLTTYRQGDTTVITRAPEKPDPRTEWESIPEGTINYSKCLYAFTKNGLSANSAHFVWDSLAVGNKIDRRRFYMILNRMLASTSRKVDIDPIVAEVDSLINEFTS